jgi:cytochrome d ubiquinol oxidase subunit I
VHDLLAARVQMAVSLGFHIIFAVVGMAMPLLMVLAEWRHVKTGDPVWLDLARRWAKGTAIFFAVGAVSGTALSFELGLLWPKFMEYAGPVIGMPFSLEGFAFFLEGIFLGIYLYGWDKVSRRAHLFAGVAVAVSGLAGGVFVVAVNAWMNGPSGFTLKDGQIVEIDFVRAFFSPSFFTQALHMSLAAYASVALVVLAVHCARLSKDPRNAFHRRAATLCLWVLTVTVPLQLLSGDLSAKHIAEHQPVKLAAAEGFFETQRGAPIALGGLPNLETRELEGAIHVPYGLSLLATGDPHGLVRGLNDFPRELWPPVTVVHVSFQVMVACGVAMFALVAWSLYLRLRKKDPVAERLFLRAATIAGPLGLIAVEAGWFVTEVGRQPWIIAGIMRTAHAVTPMPGLVVPLLGFTLLYVFLGVIVLLLLRAHVLHAPAEREPPSAPEASRP